MLVIDVYHTLIFVLVHKIHLIIVDSLVLNPKNSNGDQEFNNGIMIIETKVIFILS